MQTRQRIGFLKGRIEVQDDFAEMGRDQISEMFEEKINRMQAMVDEAAASGDDLRAMEEIEPEARARLSAG